MADFPWVYLVAWLVSVGIIIWRYEHRLRTVHRDLTDAAHRSEFLEAELLACRTKVSVVASDEQIAPPVIQSTDDTLDFLQENAVADRRDDLKIVEGIGPKIEKLMHAASIYTFSDLSLTPTEKIRNILERAGSRYLIHDPTTWPKQAELAKQGRWDELKKWQSELDKGRIV